MNNLKKYAGLLNEEAPENHFLAYITPSERDMLVDAGGVKTPTESGIFAYPPGYGGGYQGGSSNVRTTYGMPRDPLAEGLGTFMNTYTNYANAGQGQGQQSGLSQEMIDYLKKGGFSV